MVTESGAYPSLHSKCHYQIAFVKLNLNVEYPPLYERLIWDYKNADIPSVNRAIEIFDWGNSFKGTNVHEQVHFFNQTILNIFHSYIPNKTILCNDKDPPWFNNEIRKILTKKSEKGKFYYKLSTKLANPFTSSKTYWSILKTFVNGKKVPIILPLLVNDKFLTNFLEKDNLFSEFFSKQCQPPKI